MNSQAAIKEQLNELTEPLHLVRTHKPLPDEKEPQYRREANPISVSKVFYFRPVSFRDVLYDMQKRAAQDAFKALMLAPGMVEQIQAHLDTLFRSVKSIRLFGLRFLDGTLICNSEGKPLHFYARGDARLVRNQLKEQFGLETRITKGPDHKDSSYSTYPASPAYP